MATIGTAVTYLDLASRMDPDNKIRGIIELMNRTNTILDDMRVVEGNLPTGHKTTVRTGLPTVTWRLLNYGVKPSKSNTSQVTDTVGMLEGYAQVDKDLAMLNGNTAAWRLSEDSSFLESMNQEMATTLFYGNQSTNPALFTGLMPRYPAYGTDTATTVSAHNCIDTHAAATGSVQTSMWLIVWGEQTVHGIYPKGSETVGFLHEDLGEQTVADGETSAGYYQALRTHYQWKLGLTVRDWRYAVRIANIDTVLMSSTVVDLYSAMVRAYYRIPAFGMGTAVFYCNNLVLQFLQLQAMAKTTLALKYDELDGKPKTSFMGIPIKRCDALLNTEAEVVAA